jgi:hypothetical protein
VECPSSWSLVVLLTKATSTSSAARRTYMLTSPAVENLMTGDGRASSWAMRRTPQCGWCITLAHIVWSGVGTWCLMSRNSLGPSAWGRSRRLSRSHFRMMTNSRRSLLLVGFRIRGSTRIHTKTLLSQTTRKAGVKSMGSMIMCVVTKRAGVKSRGSLFLAMALLRGAAPGPLDLRGSGGWPTIVVMMLQHGKASPASRASIM